jgi:hypothetical protein
MKDEIGNYEIIRYEPRYRGEVLELLEPLWGPNREINESYLDWKYFRNPYAGNPIIYLALHEKRVVAVRPLWPCCWESASPDKYRCVQDADAIVHPDYRGQGLLRKMISIELKELENDRYDFDITLSAGQQSSISNTKMGWLKVGELSRLHWRPMKNASWLRQIGRKVPLLPSMYRHFRKDATQRRSSNNAFQPFQALDHNYERGLRFGGSGIVLDNCPRPAAMAMLVSGQSSNGRIRHVRDEKFYQWRYENPFSEYRFLFHEKTELEGYLVLQQSSHANSDSCLIVDWEFTNMKVFSDLVRATTLWGKFESISIWSATLGSNIVKLLRGLGFQGAEEDETTGDLFCSPILVKPLCEPNNWSMGGRDILNIANWDLRPIYSDAY